MGFNLKGSFVWCLLLTWLLMVAVMGAKVEAGQKDQMYKPYEYCKAYCYRYMESSYRNYVLCLQRCSQAQVV